MSYKMRAMPMEWDRKRKNNVHRGLHTSGKSIPEPDWLKVKVLLVSKNYKQSKFIFIDHFMHQYIHNVLST